jgi:hypothetical protein
MDIDWNLWNSLDRNPDGVRCLARIIIKNINDGMSGYKRKLTIFALLDDIFVPGNTPTAFTTIDKVIKQEFRRDAKCSVILEEYDKLKRQQNMFRKLGK